MRPCIGHRSRWKVLTATQQHSRPRTRLAWSSRLLQVASLLDETREIQTVLNNFYRPGPKLRVDERPQPRVPPAPKSRLSLEIFECSRHLLSISWVYLHRDKHQEEKSTVVLRDSRVTLVVQTISGCDVYTESYGSMAKIIMKNHINRSLSREREAGHKDKS